jgi:hypothetical protein
MATDTLPTYHRVVRELGVNPPEIYARCDALARFNFNETRRRVVPPKVGVKPTTKPRRKK